MNDAIAWVQARPALAGALAWLVVTLLTWMFKPRNVDEYAKLPPRVAAFLQLLGAVFGDGRKIIAALSKVITGKSLTFPEVIASIAPPPASDSVPTLILPPLDTDPATPEALRARDNERGATSFRALCIAFGVSLFSLAFLGAWLTACTPSALAAAQAAERIENSRVDYRKALLECARDHADSCAAFDVCQKAETVKRGIAPVETECLEVTRGQALDAGLLDAALDSGRL